MPVYQNTTGRSVLNRGLRFLFGFGFLVGLVNGSPVLSVQHVNLTQMLDGNLSHSGLPVLEAHCRLTQ